MSIHEQIKTRREALGWSHQRLAEEVSRLEGLHKTLAWQTVQQWENEGSAPKRTQIPYVARALGTTVGELMGLTAAEPRPSYGVEPLDRTGFGDRLHAVREVRKISVVDACAAIGIGAAELAAIEAGVAEPSVWQAKKMAKLYGYSVDALLWDDAVSPEAMKFAVRYDNLLPAQQDALETLWLTFIERPASDAEVERRMPITKDRRGMIEPEGQDDGKVER